MKNYFKPNTRSAIKVAMGIKGFTASLATMAYINSNPHLMFGVMLIGAVANEAINFLSDDTKEKEPAPRDKA